MHKIYTAFDETNHGKYPEIFVMVSTTDKKYTKEYYEEKGKRTIRWTTERLVKFFSSRENSFRCIALRNKNGLNRLPEVIPLLLNGVSEDYSRDLDFNLSLDGTIETMKKLISDNLEEFNITKISYYPKITNEPHYPYTSLLTIADSLASHLRRREEIIANPDSKRRNHKLISFNKKIHLEERILRPI